MLIYFIDCLRKKTADAELKDSNVKLFKSGDILFRKNIS